jgi:hypothetical protein
VVLFFPTLIKHFVIFLALLDANRRCVNMGVFFFSMVDARLCLLGISFCEDPMFPNKTLENMIPLSLNGTLDIRDGHASSGHPVEEFIIACLVSSTMVVDRVK